MTLMSEYSVRNSTRQLARFGGLSFMYEHKKAECEGQVEYTLLTERAAFHIVGTCPACGTLAPVMGG